MLYFLIVCKPNNDKYNFSMKLLNYFGPIQYEVYANMVQITIIQYLFRNSHMKQHYKYNTSLWIHHYSFRFKNDNNITKHTINIKEWHGLFKLIEEFWKRGFENVIFFFQLLFCNHKRATTSVLFCSFVVLVNISYACNVEGRVNFSHRIS